MEQHKRNIQGLLQTAQEKRNKALSRVKHTLKSLENESQVITFSSVARAANVTPAWLYREPNLRKQIEKLRQQTRIKTLDSSSNNIIDAKNKLIAHLKKRTNVLENKIAELERQLEIVYGELHQLKK
jgi:hypothetical protein